MRAARPSTTGRGQGAVEGWREFETDLEVTDEVMPGAVSLPHGWGHDREGTRLTVAGAHPGASINDLTDDASLDALSGNAAFNGVRVTVERAGT